MAKTTTTTTRPRKIWRAEMSTDHFSFEAYGATAKEARAAMMAGCKTHAAQCGLDAGWQLAFDVECRAFAIGQPYRDGEALTAREAGE